MSAIARLWFRLINNPATPYAFENVPQYWKDEVQELVDKEEAKNAENSDEVVQ